MSLNSEIIRNIVNPDSKAIFKSIDNDFVVFDDGSSFPVYNGIPILFGKDSIFKSDDILNKIFTTQDKSQLDTKVLKNFVRRKLLPSLTNDFNCSKRYATLNNLLDKNSVILVIGSGEKVKYYKDLFNQHTVISSDVHAEFLPDIVFDGHTIPFADETFDLVFAAQVIEHTINPWEFSKECQRVTKKGGLLQIEAPQNYPYHGAPYDFFRFTYTGFISLFKDCEIEHVEITEGNASMVAVTISNYLINTSSNKYLRRFFLLITRITLGWVKHLDKFQKNINRRTVSLPKGYAFTFKKTNYPRAIKTVLDEYYKLSK